MAFASIEVMAHNCVERRSLRIVPVLALGTQPLPSTETMDSRSVFDGIKSLVSWAVALAAASIFIRAETVSADTVSLGDRMARWLSPEVRQLDANLADIGG